MRSGFSVSAWFMNAPVIGVAPGRDRGRIKPLYPGLSEDHTYAIILAGGILLLMPPGVEESSDLLDAFIHTAGRNDERGTGNGDRAI